MTGLSQPSAPSRALWSAIDQGLSSVSNFGATIIAARELAPQGLGAYAVAYATYIILIAVCEAVSSEPLIIRHASTPHADMKAKLRDCTGLSLTAGLILGALLCCVGIAVSGIVGKALLALGLTMPALMLQDCWRFAGFASRRPRSSALNDFSWCCLQATLFAILLVFNKRPTAFWFMLAWGGGAFAGAVLGAVQFRCIPNLRAARSWLVRHRDLVAALIVDGALMNAGQQVSSYAVAAVAGLAEAASLRGAQTIFGPMTVALQSSRIFLVPETARLRETHLERFRFVAICMLVGALSACAIYGMITIVLPVSIGRELLGRTWVLSRALFPLYTLLVGGRACQAIAMIGLKGLDKPRRIVRARTRSAPLLVGSGVIGALLGDARGAVLGLALGQIVGAALWFGQLVPAYRESREQQSPREGGAIGGLAKHAKGTATSGESRPKHSRPHMGQYAAGSVDVTGPEG